MIGWKNQKERPNTDKIVRKGKNFNARRST